MSCTLPRRCVVPFFLTAPVFFLFKPRNVNIRASECMVEAGTIGALSKVMEVGAMDSVLVLVAAALRCLTQVASPSEAKPKEGTGVSSYGEVAGGKGTRIINLSGFVYTVLRFFFFGVYAP